MRKDDARRLADRAGKDIRGAPKRNAILHCWVTTAYRYQTRTMSQLCDLFVLEDRKPRVRGQTDLLSTSVPHSLRPDVRRYPNTPRETVSLAVANQSGQ